MDKNIELIISSDLMRAKQTGEITAKNLKINIEFDKRLREMNFGSAQGQVYENVIRQHPDYMDFFTKKQDTPVLGGESINQLKERIYNFMQNICNTKDESNIAISSHGAIIGNFLYYTDKGEYMQLKNADIVHIIYNATDDSFVYNGLIE